MQNNELEKKVIELEHKLQEDRIDREYREKIEQEKRINEDLSKKLKEKDDNIKFMITVIIVSVIIILI
jgi:hypothetical protein